MFTCRCAPHNSSGRPQVSTDHLHFGRRQNGGNFRHFHRFSGRRRRNHLGRHAESTHPKRCSIAVVAVVCMDNSMGILVRVHLFNVHPSKLSMSNAITETIKQGVNTHSLNSMPCTMNEQTNSEASFRAQNILFAVRPSADNIFETFNRTLEQTNFVTKNKQTKSSHATIQV